MKLLLVLSFFLVVITNIIFFNFNTCRLPINVDGLLIQADICADDILMQGSMYADGMLMQRSMYRGAILMQRSMCAGGILMQRGVCTDEILWHVLLNGLLSQGPQNCHAYRMWLPGCC